MTASNLSVLVLNLPASLLFGNPSSHCLTDHTTFPGKITPVMIAPASFHRQSIVGVEVMEKVEISKPLLFQARSRCEVFCYIWANCRGNVRPTTKEKCPVLPFYMHIG